MGGVGSCIEASSASDLSWFHRGHDITSASCWPAAQGVTVLWVRSGRQTGYKHVKTTKIEFCMSTPVSSLSIRHLSVFIRWFLMNREVSHGVKWLPGALSPLCFPVLVGAWRLFGSLLTFGATRVLQSAFLHEVGPCWALRKTHKI